MGTVVIVRTSLELWFTELHVKKSSVFRYKPSRF